MAHLHRGDVHRFKHVKMMGNEVELVGFDLNNETVIAVCRQGKRKARVSLESIEFPASHARRGALAESVEALRQDVADCTSPHNMRSLDAYRRCVAQCDSRAREMACPSECPRSSWWTPSSAPTIRCSRGP